MPQIRLRPIRISDAETCFRWVTDPEVSRHLGLLTPPADVRQERAWISSVLVNREQQRVFVIENEESRPIGTCGLRNIERSTGTATLGIMIGEKEAWGRGYGTAAVKALLRYAFEDLGLAAVRLSCHVDNTRALRCYGRSGFVPSEHVSDRLVFGRAEIVMAIDRARWEELQGGEMGEGGQTDR